MSDRTDLELPKTMRLEDAPDATGAASGAGSDPAAESESAPKPLTPREEAMLRIAENRQRVVERELEFGREQIPEAVAAAEPEPAPEPDAAPEPAPEPKAAEPAPQPPKVEPPATAPEPHQQTFGLDIGGQRVNVTQEQLFQLARMGIAANQAMQAHQQAPAPVAAPQPPAPAQPILTDDEAKAFHRRMVYGDEADGSNAIRELISAVAQRVQTPAVDPARVASFAEERALTRMRMEQNLSTIGQEYPDIFADRTLSQLAALKLSEVRAEDSAIGIPRPDLAAYREACNRVRAIRGVPPQPQPGAEIAAASAAPHAAPSVGPMAARLERKRAAPATPAGVSRAARMPETPRTPSGAELVNAMRRARGQPALN